MTEASAPAIKTVLHPVSDLEKAKAVYTALLGAEPQVDQPFYVSYEVGGQHIGLVPGGKMPGSESEPLTAPLANWHVADIDATLAEVIAAGGTVKDPVRGVGGTRKVATFTDPDGNLLGLIQE